MQVMLGNADFGHAAFSTTLERSQVISYGNPYYRDEWVIQKPFVKLR